MATGVIPLSQHCKSRLGPPAKPLDLGRFSCLDTAPLQKQSGPGHHPVTSVGRGLSKMLRYVSWLAAWLAGYCDGEALRVKGWEDDASRVLGTSF